MQFRDAKPHIRGAGHRAESPGFPSFQMRRRMTPRSHLATQGQFKRVFTVPTKNLLFWHKKFS
jgi:hypothetical protein